MLKSSCYITVIPALDLNGTLQIITMPLMGCCKCTSLNLIMLFHLNTHEWIMLSASFDCSIVFTLKHFRPVKINIASIMWGQKETNRRRTKPNTRMGNGPTVDRYRQPSKWNIRDNTMESMMVKQKHRHTASTGWGDDNNNDCNSICSRECFSTQVFHWTNTKKKQRNTNR